MSDDIKKGARVRMRGKRKKNSGRTGRIIEPGLEVSLVDIDGMKQYIPNSHFDIVKE